jgi:hypothetical protein
MNLKPLGDFSLIMTAGSNEAEATFREQRFNSIEVDPESGTGC